MNRRARTFVELAALGTTAGYVFWRWADHASYGGPIGSAVIFHLAFLSIVVAVLVWRVVPTPGLPGIVAGVALIVCICYMVSLGEDLARFRALGGPGSKEMMELLRHQHVDAEAAPVFLEAAALRIQREFWFTGLITLVLLAYLSRLLDSVKRTRAETAGASSAPENPGKS
jgi:hypothetical protein